MERRDPGRRPALANPWAWTLAGLVALRVLIPLAALAAAPTKLPLLPGYTYAPLGGDAYGFYAAVVNIFVATRTVLSGWIGLASLALMISFLAAAWILWRSGVRWLALLLPAFGLCLVFGVVVHDMNAPGAGVVGWPLVWALSLAPLAVFHVALTPGRAFPAGLAVSLLANAAIVVATAYIGLRATGRRAVGLIAAGLYASWPLWVALVAGTQAWQNGQWKVDVGLSLYAEPVSTALVAVALAIIVSERLDATPAAVAGLLIGFATAVKLTNGPVAAVFVLLVALRSGVRSAAILTLGALVSAPIVLGFWGKGYVDKTAVGGVDLGALYQWRFVSTNLRTSTIFTGTMLLVLVPLAAVGVLALAGWFRRSLFIASVVVTVAAYAGYYVTNQHPRFYYVILPSVFVLQAAGAVSIWRSPAAGSVRRARRPRLRDTRPPSRPPAASRRSASARRRP